MKMKNKNLITLADFKDTNFGKVGTPKRTRIGLESFKIGAMIQAARLEKGLTQEKLAGKIGSSKSNISKIENNLKEVRLSTLRKIVELGLGGNLQLSFQV